MFLNTYMYVNAKIRLEYRVFPFTSFTNFYNQNLKLEKPLRDHPGSIAKLVFPTECFLQNRPIKKTQDVEEVKKLDYFLSPGVRGCLTHRLPSLYRPHSRGFKPPGQRGPKCKICGSSPATDWSWIQKPRHGGCS